MDGREVEFSEGFTDLHTRVYEKTLAGEGFTLADARASIELVHQIRTSLVPSYPRPPTPIPPNCREKVAKPAGSF
jgi:hypothetical protein